MPGLQRASLSLTTIIMLILRLDIHLHNQGGYFVFDDSDDGSPNSPSPYYNIPSPSKPLSQNTYQEGYIYL